MSNVVNWRHAGSPHLIPDSIRQVWSIRSARSVTLLSKDTRREAHPWSFALAAHPRKIADRPNPCRALRRICTATRANLQAQIAHLLRGTIVILPTVSYTGHQQSSGAVNEAQSALRVVEQRLPPFIKPSDKTPWRW